MKVKNLYDIQGLRIAVENRKDKKGAASDIKLTKTDKAYNAIMKNNLDKIEKDAVKALKPYVEGTEIWKQFLEGVTGIGTKMAAVILSEFDIHRGSTVSKLWAVSGLGMEKKFCVTYRDHKCKEEEDGKLTVTKKVTKWETKEVWATSPGSAKGVVPKPREEKIEREFKEDPVRIGSEEEVQRKRKGQYPSYNAFLKTKLCGVMMPNMIRISKRKVITPPKYVGIYEDYRKRLDSGERYKDWTKAHCYNAAIRYSVKMFLIDLYVAWRTVEGLTVRPPYVEEKLGMEPHGS